MTQAIDKDSSHHELQKQYDLLTEEIQFLRNSERTDDLSPRERFRLKKQIQEAEEERDRIAEQLKETEVSPPEGKSIYRSLLRLGYRKQVRLFRRVVESHAIAAFLIHGYPDYGQSWLLNRIVVQYVPYFLTGKVIKVYTSRKIRRNDVSALWREVARRVGLRGKQYTPAEISQQISQCLQTQNVLLVFHEVETLPEQCLSELIENFWLPLVEAVQAGANPPSQFKLLMFLVDYEGCVGGWPLPFAEKLTAGWKPQTLIKSPIITEFSDNDLIDWIEAEYDRLPPALTAQVDDTVESILEDTEDGIPELVLDMICDRCGYDWYEESKKWLSL